jgi:hypothetical protein
MRRTLGLAFALSLFLVPAASADIPLPKDLKYVDPRVSFEGIDKLPDHVFFLRFLTFAGGPSGVPHTLIEVADAKPFNLNAQRRLLDFTLLAMDRKTYEAKSKDAPAAKWLTDKTEGVLKAAVPTPSTTAPASLKEVPVTPYRVTLTDGKLKVEQIAMKKTSAAPVESSSWLVGVALAISFAWLGLWFVRRGRTAV